MFNVILAMDNNNGIGSDNSLPWYFSQDLKLFKTLTTNNVPFQKNIVIMGRKTMETIPNKFLSERINIVISRSDNITNKNVKFVKSFSEALNLAYSVNGLHSQNIWVIGGAEIYNLAFRHRDLNKIYYTKIDSTFNCDTFVKLPKHKILSFYQYDDINKNDQKIYKLKYITVKPYLNAENQYLNLLKDILNNGEKRMTRNGYTYSLFSKNLKFDVSDSFPLLTTKKMFWKGIVEELLFFIRGDTNTKKLEEKGIKIWKGNTTREFLDSLGLDYEEGEMGPMYGYQWRNFNSENIDQLQNVINDINNNPSSRRILMTDFNPSQVSQGVLYPCHSLILQFYVEDEKLSVNMYQRSADVFLGLPFNIASTSLLLYMIAKITNKIPSMVTITLGDCHIYESHKEQCLEQLKRETFNQPNISIPELKTIKDIEDSSFEDYKLVNYNYLPTIKAKMIA